MQVMDNMDIKPETPESRKKYPTQLFQCRSCEKAFKFQCNLDSHSLVHSGKFSPSLLQKDY